MPAPRTILITSALPYANGPLHIGHMVEFVQADIWKRFQRLCGHTCHYVCADDAHGTPIMLKAEDLNLTPEQLIQQVFAEHTRDLANFAIDLDCYHTTHSDENRTLAELFYQKLKEGGHITRREVEQFYDPKQKMFLPDRYVRGGCPRCAAENQYGDSCEACGATYLPTDLKDPKSALTGEAPERRSTEQLFFRLEHFREFLEQWLTAGHTQTAVANKQRELFKQPLLEWDISRNAPYWGFEIPGEADKYFYVWLDAPIGYLASFRRLCDERGLDFDAYLKPDSEYEMHHFIGKDIARFHTLFWPALLQGAGLRTPTGVWCHGFLSVNGQKMSKSRGTFITAETYARHLDPEYLRYYFATKLDGGMDDMDLNIEDFKQRVDSDLVGKLVNLASRCAGFIAKSGNGRLADRLPAPDMYAEFAAAAPQLAEYYESRQYHFAMRDIMRLADQANQYINKAKPWVLAKQGEADAVRGIATQGLNLFRVLMLYLTPVLPQTAARADALFNQKPLTWADAATPLLDTPLAAYEPLLTRIDEKSLGKLLESEGSSETGDGSETDSKTDFATLDDMDRLGLRVGRVLVAEAVEGSDKLLHMEVDLGDEKRNIFSGIKAFYTPEKLTGRLVIVVTNLAPRKMRFGVSEGMIITAERDGKVYLLAPDAGAEPGMAIR